MANLKVNLASISSPLLLTCQSESKAKPQRLSLYHPWTVEKMKSNVCFSSKYAQKTEEDVPKSPNGNVFPSQNGSLPTKTFNPLDPEVFSEESHAVIEFIADYYREIEQHPVRSEVEPGYLKHLVPNSPPLYPQPMTTILEDVKRDIFPGLTHWQSPNFYAYFQANASTAGFLGEMLCSGLNTVGFNWISSPAGAELEGVVTDWIAKMLNLPTSFTFSGGEGGGGVIHGSTCEAVVCTLAAARDKALEKLGAQSITKLVVYVSDQTHFAVQKGAKLVGIPTCNLRVIPTSAASGYALTADTLSGAIERDVTNGLVPLYLCGTTGTTAVGAMDPLLELGRVAKEYNVWFHVDAACAGNAGICPEFRRYFNGVELADSFSLNPHKWLLTNMDCCCLWVKSSAALTDSLSTSPEILRNKPTDDKAAVHYKDWQISLSRRFRAMKVWVVIKRYGVVNLREHIRSDIVMAKRLEKLIAMDERFEVVVPRHFSLVCFRLKPIKGEEFDGSEMNQRLIEAINSSGRAFMTHAVVDGEFILRFAIGATLTEMRHVEATWRLIQAKAEEIVEAMKQEVIKN